MKILVIGNWHLAFVTAASLLKIGHSVTLLTSEKISLDFKNKLLPIEEKGLNNIIFNQSFSGRLNVIDKFDDIDNRLDICWICHDLDIENSTEQKFDFISRLISRLDHHIKKNTEVIISSQIPLGTTEKLFLFINKNKINKRRIFIVPENLQLGEGVNSFLNQSRFIIGTEKRIYAFDSKIFSILKNITDEIYIMSYASAELSKHALNSYLALNIAFANEIGRIAKSHNASSEDIVKSLKSDLRVGPKAYIKPGSAFHGGTLKRDLKTLDFLSMDKEMDTPLLKSIIKSNEIHSNEVLNIIKANKNIYKILMIGLSYKLNSNALRDSFFVRDLNILSEKNYSIKCFDPDISLNDPRLKNLRNNKVKFLENINIINLQEFDCVIMNKIHKNDLEIFVHKLENLKKIKKVITLIDLNGFTREYSDKLIHIKQEIL